uniref:Uncharacterized protein n=1 Tax=Ditylenchus dipsaci TaxID=166011 RepID=A0A915DL42_9BILA
MLSLTKHDSKFKKFRKISLRKSLQAEEEEPPQTLVMKSLSTIAKINFDKNGYIYLTGSQRSNLSYHLETRLVIKEGHLADSYIGIKSAMKERAVKMLE